jgi:response regulator RpfG family c-di-GMP phosphodiesterase
VTMQTQDDDFFPDDDPNAPGPDAGLSGAEPWLMLVVDDEPAVHSITRVALHDMVYKGRRLALLNAYSGKEALKILKDRDDIAIVLLDVVMETDDAGLNCARAIRETLGNKLVRIVLRTGQPGQAPERKVILEYDINDYKAKTELTQERLYTSIVTALRSYDDLMEIEMNRRILEANRQGLEKVVAASSSLFQFRSMRLFTTGVLTQIGAILDIDCEGILCARIDDRPGGSGAIQVIAASGRFEPLVDRPLSEADADSLQTIRRAIEAESSQYGKDSTALFVRTPNDRRLVVYLRTRRELTVLDRKLLEVFSTNVSVGLDNLHLYEEVRRAHQATVVALADLAEYKDQETGEHVLRVAGVCESIAQIMLERRQHPDIVNDLFVEQIGTASILHDVGKVAIPDHVLLKPGPLDAEEKAVMQAHASKGGSILQRAAETVGKSNTLKLAATIANAHHERWDGTGYPLRLAGADIPLSARIVSVADVYDALTHKRPYKEAWPQKAAIDYIREQSGTQFDPALVDAFLEVMRRRGLYPTS